MEKKKVYAIINDMNKKMEEFRMNKKIKKRY